MDKKLKYGQYLKGQEPYGCYNTGVAVVICRSKQAKKYTGYEYIVSCDIDVTLNLTDLLLDKMRGKKITSRFPKQKPPKFFKTKTAAFKEFEKRNNAMVESVKRDIETVNELKRKANAGDMQAAISLMDY